MLSNNTQWRRSVCCSLRAEDIFMSNLRRFSDIFIQGRFKSEMDEKEMDLFLKG